MVRAMGMGIGMDNHYQLPKMELQRIVDGALAEDIGWGDVTTSALIGPEWVARGELVAKGEGVLAGVAVMECVFHSVSPAVEVAAELRDGATLKPGATIACVQGPAAEILSAERVALNFLQRLSGVATLTRRYVEAVAGLSVRIVDTRKTTPGLRSLEKYAVRVGGGFNHRHNLSDGVLIKDNHLIALADSGIKLSDAIALARRRVPHTVKVEVEVETADLALEAADAGADVVMLDNMSVAEMRRAVKLIRGRALLEASGGVNLNTVRSIAETGVDLISVGALTHSAPALDISLDLELSSSAGTASGASR
jgi:nicotinate-nucleotide pyrophosphorylase (carboxylating)